MPLDSCLQEAMLAAIPSLRGVALALCRRRDRADDLVQEALLHAINGIDSFKPGTNMAAWLTTILRNHFCNEFRKYRCEVSDREGLFVGSLTAQPRQEAHLRFGEFRAALAKLPDDQREALLLVGGAGLSYDEAAAICRCPAGTIKSRINRGRTRLAALLSIETADDLGPDKTIQAALNSGGMRWAA